MLDILHKKTNPGLQNCFYKQYLENPGFILILYCKLSYFSSPVQNYHSFVKHTIFSPLWTQ